MEKQELLVAIAVLGDGQKGKFAKAIGVDNSTVSRWMSGGGMHSSHKRLIREMMKNKGE